MHPKGRVLSHPILSDGRWLPNILHAILSFLPGIVVQRFVVAIDYLSLFQAAQKLLEYSMRTLSKDRLLSLRKNQPLMSLLTDAELSLHLDVDASDYIAPARAQKKQRDDNAYLTFEPVPDHLPAKDIIAIAKVRQLCVFSNWFYKLEG